MILQGTTPTLTVSIDANELSLEDVIGSNSLTAKIYVPEALIDDYKAATNWKTIDGYGFVEWLPIEGSEYEL